MRSILPHDALFFDQFEKLAGLIVIAAEELEAMLRAGPPWEAKARRIKTLEHEADEIVHHSLDHLHRTFVTPFDHLDIRKIVEGLDDIIDLTDAASSRVDLYLPKEVLQEALDLAHVLVLCSHQVREIMSSIRTLKKNGKRLQELSVEVNRLENEADQLRRSALARLFRNGGDVLEVIKWKDILEQIETATDRAEDVAVLVDGIVQENT
jgi:predicted phosphate transport protein (TIGR00153 family)